MLKEMNFCCLSIIITLWWCKATFPMHSVIHTASAPERYHVSRFMVHQGDLATKSPSTANPTVHTNT